MEGKQAHIRQLMGTVISDKMEKTLVVAVERTYRHPRLDKVLRTVKRYKAHYEGSDIHIGDRVTIQEGRPVSKTKYMYVTGIVTKL
jgi:small subunit ribosomal protein S17